MSIYNWCADWGGKYLCTLDLQIEKGMSLYTKSKGINSSTISGIPLREENEWLLESEAWVFEFYFYVPK